MKKSAKKTLTKSKKKHTIRPQHKRKTMKDSRGTLKSDLAFIANDIKQTAKQAAPAFMFLILACGMTFTFLALIGALDEVLDFLAIFIQ